jgi:hypothetical protein
LVAAILFLLTGACAVTLSAQELIASTAELPDAPSMQTPQQAPRPASATPQAGASISGTVSDIRGGLVPGAEVRLLSKAHPEPRIIDSDSEGRFTFADVPPGSYTVEIISPGLETFLSPVMVLHPGQKFEMPDIALPIASASTTVDVVMTQTQVADEELKMETKQRIIGIVPNFYTSFLWNAAPLNTRQKFKLSFRSVTDPVAFVSVAIVAGIEQHQNTFPEYGDGAEGYGKRYGAAYGDAVIGRVFGSAVFPSIFRQDPRYFYMGPASSTAKRLKHAALAGLIAKGDNGKWQPNYSHVLGNASAGALSTVYHPDSNGPGELAFDNAVIGIAGGAFQAIIREFVWPHFTHNVPTYAKGKPAPGAPAVTLPNP